MKVYKVNLQNTIVYALSSGLILYCIFSDSLTIAAIYGLLVTVYFHVQIVFNKLILKQYIIINVILFIIFMAISFLYTLYFKKNTDDIVMASIGLQTLLLVGSILYKRHFHL